MRTALAILGALLVAPFVLGFVAGVAVCLNVPIVSRWLERRLSEIALRTRPLHKGSGDRPTTPRPDFPDKHYYRRTRPS